MSCAIVRQSFMRISFELEDSQLLSERPEQRYTVLVDPSMQTVGELV